MDIVVADARFEGEPHGQRIEWTPPDREYPVLAHLDLLRSAIENVLRNAIAHGEAGTTIKVDLKMTDGDAFVEVLDFGKGVPEDQLEDIFKPFHRGTTRAKGAGIGLAISRQAMDLMKGTIRAVKAPDAGLRVSLSLPLSSEAPLSHPA